MFFQTSQCKVECYIAQIEAEVYVKFTKYTVHWEIFALVNFRKQRPFSVIRENMNSRASVLYRILLLRH